MMRDNTRDVDRGVAHALDRGDDVQNARHLLGLALRARREHADLAHLVHELGETLLELVHLVGHARVAEEQRGVPEIDHELGGVLRLRQHGLQVSWSFFHGGDCSRAAQVRPRSTIARISDSAPKRSRLDVTMGMP